MTLPRSAFLAACFGLLFALLSAAAPAAEDAPKWDPSRTSAPESIAELKALQSTVEGVVEKCTPATVAVLYGPSAGSGAVPAVLLVRAAYAYPMQATQGGRGGRAAAQRMLPLVLVHLCK